MSQERPDIPKDLIRSFAESAISGTCPSSGLICARISGPESDIDFLVEFEEGCTPGYFELADMEEELSALLGGPDVDLRTPKELSRFFRDEIMAEALVYESFH